jgi:hypothetical protein
MAAGDVDACFDAFYSCAHPRGTDARGGLSSALRTFGVPSSSGVEVPWSSIMTELVARAINTVDSTTTADPPTRSEGFAQDPAAPWGQSTTVMIRNIGLGLSKVRLIKALEAHGFGGHFDFLSVPRRTGRCNLGYCFVNFRSPDWAMLCHDRFHGRSFGRGGGARRCEVLPANRQRHGSSGCASSSGSSSAGTHAGDAPADAGHWSAAAAPLGLEGLGFVQPSGAGHTAPAGQWPGQEAAFPRFEFQRIYL